MALRISLLSVAATQSMVWELWNVSALFWIGTRSQVQWRRAIPVCAPHVIPGKFLTYGVLYSGGNVIRELRDRLFRPRLEKSGTDIYQEMFHGIDRVENRLLVIPHLFGSGTPGMNQEEGACVLGIRPDTAPEEILQAVIEGLAFDMRINIENMERAGIPVRQIRAAGGGGEITGGYAGSRRRFGAEAVYPKRRAGRRTGSVFHSGKGPGVASRLFRNTRIY